MLAPAPIVFIFSLFVYFALSASTEGYDQSIQTDIRISSPNYTPAYPTIAHSHTDTSELSSTHMLFLFILRHPRRHQSAQPSWHCKCHQLGAKGKQPVQIVSILFCSCK